MAEETSSRYNPLGLARKEERDHFVPSLVGRTVSPFLLICVAVLLQMGWKRWTRWT